MTKGKNDKIYDLEDRTTKFGEEAIKLFVVDGMTRTKYAADHKGTKLPDYPYLETFRPSQDQLSSIYNTLKLHPPLQVFLLP